MVLGIATLCLFLVGVIWIFSDVRVGEKRRLLQNVVYRGYQLIAWLLAVWQGVDAGLHAYYTQRAQSLINPINEREYPAVLVEQGQELLAEAGASGQRRLSGAQPLPMPIRCVIPAKAPRRRPARIAHA